MESLFCGLIREFFFCSYRRKLFLSYHSYQGIRNFKHYRYLCTTSITDTYLLYSTTGTVLIITERYENQILKKLPVLKVSTLWKIES